MVRFLQLTLLLQGLLLNRYRAVSVETFMANNCVLLLGSTGTLWRPSITINVAGRSVAVAITGC